MAHWARGIKKRGIDNQLDKATCLDREIVGSILRSGTSGCQRYLQKCANILLDNEYRKLFA